MSGNAHRRSRFGFIAGGSRKRPARISTARPSLFESLEARQLFAAFDVKVNFQPAGSLVPAGYLVDSGHVLGSRGNGYTYGWKTDNQANARDRNFVESPDQRYDTINRLQNTNRWSINVPNGTYQVKLVAGDPANFDNVYKINVENVLAINGTGSAATRWFEGNVQVNVTDGNLAITPASGAVDMRLAFVDIVSVDSPPPPSDVVVSFSDGIADGKESPLDKGTWVLSRTGSLAQSLTVNYTVGGSATAGNDYQTLSGTVTFAAGSATVNLVVTPINDSLVEGVEQVTATIVAGAGYNVGSANGAVCDIISEDTNNPTVTWTTSNAPVAPNGRVEPGVVQVGNNLYILGGFDGIGDPLHVTNRVDVFNLATRVWSTAANLPAGAAQTHGGVASDGTYIYLVAGQVGSGYGPGTNASFRYHIATNTWSSYVALPEIRYGGAMTYLNGKLYYVGGDEADRTTTTTTHWTLDTTSQDPQWTSLAPIPEAGDHLGHAVYNGKIYIVGGEHGHASTANPDAATYIQHSFLFVYDPGTDAWTRLADMPVAASHFEGAIHVIGSKIAIFGGNDMKDGQTNKVQVFDIIAGTWSVITNSVPDARQGPASGIYNGKIFYTMGYSETLGRTTRSYWGTLTNFV